MKKNRTFTYEEAKKSMEYFCVYQERNYQEISNKLLKMHLIPEVQDEILLHLIKNDFLNEERYAKAFVRGKFINSKWGRIKITFALQKKNISKKNIEIGLKEIEESKYLETLLKLSEIKSKQIKIKNKFEKNKKLLNYLQQKGYETSLIYNLVLNTE